ncbi:HdeD family acid-resistance protein [Cellulomonas olei]|uniref:HdeD family acid-resistance protein n=1 Tax=Cellulomonas sp. P4 TaxID=3142533 RepID=UPI0031BB98D6
MADDVEGRLAAVLRSVWWLPVLRGVLLVVLGLLLLVEPLGTLVALIWVFGVFAVVDGAVVLLQALLARGRPGFGWLVAEGLVGIGFGALIMLWPGATALVLFYLLALWLIVLGVTAVVVAVTQFRARDLAWAGTLVFGLIAFLFGLLLAIRPQGTVDVIVTAYGLFAFVAGVVMVVAGLATRSFGRQLAAAGRSGPGAAGPTTPA